MTWDWLVQRTGKYCSIRRMEYPEFQTRIFGRMESAPAVVGHGQRFKPEVAILGADQKEPGLWGREWGMTLRWMETVCSTFQDLQFDGSL